MLSHLLDTCTLNAYLLYKLKTYKKPHLGQFKPQQKKRKNIYEQKDSINLVLSDIKKRLI